MLFPMAKLVSGGESLAAQHCYTFADTNYSFAAFSHQSSGGSIQSPEEDENAQRHRGGLQV